MFETEALLLKASLSEAFTRASSAARRSGLPTQASFIPEGWNRHAVELPPEVLDL